MLSPFVYEALPMRVLFGNGTVAKLAFEAERLGMKRVLCSPRLNRPRRPRTLPRLWDR